MWNQTKSAHLHICRSSSSSSSLSLLKVVRTQLIHKLHKPITVCIQHMYNKIITVRACCICQQVVCSSILLWGSGVGLFYQGAEMIKHGLDSWVAKSPSVHICKTCILTLLAEMICDKVGQNLTNKKNSENYTMVFRTCFVCCVQSLCCESSYASWTVWLVAVLFYVAIPVHVWHSLEHIWVCK